MTADAEAAPRLAAESPLQSGCDLTSLASTPVDEARFLEARGFFDKLYYLDDNPDVAASDVDPFEHFFLYGYKEGRKPNIAFDTRWYLETYSDVRAAGVNCLLHYALLGEREGRRPGALFDVEWYRERHRIDESDSAVLHYLRGRRTGVSPIPHFDAAYYLTTYPDIATAGVDPFEHFMSYGFSEGQIPRLTSMRISMSDAISAATTPAIHCCIIFRSPTGAGCRRNRGSDRRFPIWSKGIEAWRRLRGIASPAPGRCAQGQGPCLLPPAVPPDRRKRQVVGRRLHRMDQHRPRPAENSRTISSHAFRATWASTICSIST